MSAFHNVNIGTLSLVWKIRRTQLIFDFILQIFSLMYCEKVASWLMVTPRSRRYCCLLIGVPIFELYSIPGAAGSLLEGLYRINSNFSELNSMLLLTAQLYTEFRSAWSCRMSSSLVIPWPIRVSSAKLDKNEVATSWSISPISMRNRSGPNTDLCGTPDTTGLGWDFFPSNSIDWRRPLRKLWSNLPRCPWIPRDLSFLRVIPMSTLSKAFAKSRYTMSTQFPSSRRRVIWSNWAKSWLEHDIVLRKPCWLSFNKSCSSKKLTSGLRITFSKVLTSREVRATGRYFFGMARLFPLCMGVMFAFLQISGTMPSFIDFLQIRKRGCAKESLHYLSIMAGKPSGPAAEFDGNSFMALIRSSSPKSISDSPFGIVSSSINRLYISALS